MSHELVYTSAPQGLKTGSRGFCTVVTTANMARNLMERLESFSGYRHAFMVHEAGAAQNPVNYTHYHTAVGGRKYHVLSRIADAGLDYTQRSNKLAHHVALEPGETAAAPGGPAWVMAAPGFFQDQWDGQVRTLAAGSQPTPSDRPPKVCRIWKQLTGDAGWAGVLAESALGPGNPMSVIFPAGTPSLELVVEALALLPPERRWQVTFSTYFTKAPAGVNCQWRFVLDGTPEATSLRRDGRAAVIDLCRPLEQAQGGELVEAARAGVAPRRMAVRSAAPPPRPATRGPRPAPEAVASDDDLGELTLAPLSPPSPARRFTVPPPWQTAKRPKSILYLLPIAAVGLLILGLALALGTFWVNTQRFLAERASRPDLSDKPPNAAVKTPGDPVDEDESGDEPQDKTEAPEPDASTEEAIESGEPDGASEPQTETTTEEASPDPFSDIREPNNRLRLPETTSGHKGTIPRSKAEATFLALANLHIKDSSDVELHLLDGEFHRLEKEKPSDAHPEPRWEIWRWEETGLGDRQRHHVATFVVEQGELRFRWEKQPSVRLGFCSLQISAYDETVTCLLEIPPRTEPSAVLTLEPDVPIQLPSLEDCFLRKEDDLVLQIRIRGLSGDESPKSCRLKLELTNTSGTEIPLPLPKHQTNKQQHTSIKLTLNANAAMDRFWIEARLLGFVTVLQTPKKKPDAYVDSNKWQSKPKLMELTKKEIESHRKSVETEYSNFKRVMNGRGFPDHHTWSKLPSDVRKQVVSALSDSESGRQNVPEIHAIGQKHLLAAHENLELAKIYNKHRDVLDEVVALQEMIEKLKKDLRNQARVDYRLFVTVGKREIDLILTESFHPEELESTNNGVDLPGKNGRK